ncbi:MAG: branched-chain amino acid ABC transporter permease [Chloroflexi bacterium]|nr:branched-chain amino acid ABC transporter permease [Chloroflexota bacterium]
MSPGHFVAHNWALSLAIVLLLFPLGFRDRPYIMHTSTITLITIGYVASLRLKLSAYLLDLGHLVWAGIGAYLSTVLMIQLGMPFWANIFLLPPMVGVLAGLIAIPATRAVAVYLAIVTISLGSLAVLFFSNIWRGVFGGTGGIWDIPGPNALGPVVFSKPDHTQYETAYFYLALALLLLIFFVLWRIEHSRIGLTFRSIREQAPLAEAMGINLRREKVICFGIASAMAAALGIFYAHYVHVVTPEAFGIGPSFVLFVYVVVGGRGHILGPAVGAISFIILSEKLRFLELYQPFFLGLALIVFMRFIPDGIAGLGMRLAQRFKSRQLY